MALFSEYRFKCLSRKHVMHVFHTVLTFAVTLALFIYDTDLQHAMESGRLGAPIVFVFLVIFSLALFFAVSLKDPGFVQVDEEYSSKEEEELICDGDSSATTTSSKTVTHSLRRRRCGHCEILQPLRARHCMECGHCVRRFDHHCPWLDTCVGEGNHALFVFFLTFQLVTATWALALAWSGFVPSSPSHSWLACNGGLLIVMIVGAVAALPSGLLLAFHLHLAATGATTWETMSWNRVTYLRSHGSEHNPFDRGLLQNLHLFFCHHAWITWEKPYRAFLETETV
uniref:Palmitoyltransferase n=1 Tax=Eptatretus burgeri TaxID=7764 RepID=A0A8C4QZX5_EPTBU